MTFGSPSPEFIDMAQENLTGCKVITYMHISSQTVFLVPNSANFFKKMKSVHIFLSGHFFVPNEMIIIMFFC